MATSGRWTISTAFLWCALLCWHGFGALSLGGESAPVFRAVYGLGYFVFAVTMLGAVARLWAHAGAPLWRPVMLVSAAGFALAQVWIVHLVRGAPLRLDTWMAALLGIAIAAIAPRFLPAAWLRSWLNVEHRGSGR